MNVLLVEDEAKNRQFCTARSGRTGVYSRPLRSRQTKATNWPWNADYDVLLLDIMVPGMDGLAILKALRQAGRNLPVILLTARNELDDRLQGLNLGADDYLAKPFYVEELIARIHAVVRRSVGERQNRLSVGPLTLDRITREVTCAGQRMELTNAGIQSAGIPDAVSRSGADPHPNSGACLGLQL